MPLLYLFRVLAAVEIGRNDDWVLAGRKSNSDVIALIGRPLGTPTPSLVPGAPFSGEAGSQPLGTRGCISHPLQKLFARIAP